MQLCNSQTKCDRQKWNTGMQLEGKAAVSNSIAVSTVFTSVLPVSCVPTYYQKCGCWIHSSAVLHMKAAVVLACTLSHVERQVRSRVHSISACSIGMLLFCARPQCDLRPIWVHQL